MHDALGKPPFFLVDNRPIVPPMIIVASHEVAEQISRPSKDFPYSVTKSSSVDRIFDLIGPNSILLKQVKCLSYFGVVVTGAANTDISVTRMRNGSKCARGSTLGLPLST